MVFFLIEFCQFFLAANKSLSSKRKLYRRTLKPIFSITEEPFLWVFVGRQNFGYTRFEIPS